MATVLSVSDLLVNQFEPKRKYRWHLGIEGVDAYLLKTAQRPTINFEEVAVHWINGIRYLAGKANFEPITLGLHDPIAPSGAQQVMEWIRLGHEHISQRSGYAAFYKRDITLRMLDPLGAVVEHWDIKGAWTKNVNYGDLSYEDNDIADITVEVRFDLAALQF